MYGHGSRDAPPRKVGFEDLGELRKEIWKLVDEEALEIDWPHILAARHRIGREEVIATLLEGRLEFHSDLDGRFVSRADTARFTITAIFEVLEEGDRRFLHIRTAFKSRSRARRR